MTTVRLIATDLDGTLLGPDGRIAAPDAHALLQASQRGIHLVVATGRPARWLGCLEPILAAKPLVIVSNGAAVVDLASGRMTRVQAIPGDAVAAVAGRLRAARPEVLFGIEHGFEFHCEPAWPLREFDPSGTLVEDPRAVRRAHWEELAAGTSPVVKLLAMAEGVTIDAFATQATSLVGDLVTVTHSSPPGSRGMVEMSASGVTKATTLARLAAELGVAPGAVAAFGDMPNDQAMLEFAGRGFAMGNAHPALRSRFEAAPGNHEGGVGHTVRALLGQPSDQA
ncbi:MAG TPA: HAD-IIB family hydrolase [Propioniciclava sp.]|jgi:Cof subfamily protein (haloacid dehalogenase superfamily)|uniref:HAD family hydrolase n=1 Tax=Propioniciclava sp. TaxID=2038686 RepID=UPI002BE61015|nr:HAD-IIB family hydrolase [Propioniciclava sp.]HRL48296.1 HAD-IIB family hydrolase [Propioniciclava sp.]HRL78927.1 HAD-IIB family hydrolase [Propioniciclava sp.]